MDLHLPERQSVELAGLAARTGRSEQELLAEAVDRMVADQRWFDAQVQVGIDQIERGEFLEENEMDARVARMNRLEVSALVAGRGRRS
jgi:predicted transcriptional regulator